MPASHPCRQRRLRDEKLLLSGRVFGCRFLLCFRNEVNQSSHEESNPGSALTLPASFTLREKEIHWNRLKRVVPLGGLALSLSLFGCHHSSVAKSGRSLDFNQDVQPILAA